MKTRFFRVAALGVAVVFAAGLFAGCAETTKQVQEHPRTATGAAVGGVGGAVVGGLLGGGKGALIGGLLGALGGGVVGNYTEKKQAPREQALQETGAQPGQSAISVQQVTAQPQTVAPGQQVDIGMTYSVVTPQPNETANVRETREITFNNQVVGQMSVDRQRTSGTWQSDVPVTLPQTAQPGTYTILASVTAGGMTNSRTTTFTVK